LLFLIAGSAALGVIEYHLPIVSKAGPCGRNRGTAIALRARSGWRVAMAAWMAAAKSPLRHCRGGRV